MCRMDFRNEQKKRNDRRQRYSKSKLDVNRQINKKKTISKKNKPKRNKKNGYYQIEYKIKTEKLPMIVWLRLFHSSE